MALFFSSSSSSFPKLGTGFCHIEYFNTVVTEDQFLKKLSKIIESTTKYIVSVMFIYTCSNVTEGI